MKKILFVYPSMGIGGSTTSLLGLLHELNYEKYEVDLQLYENTGPCLSLIPEQVNLLPPARSFSHNKMVGYFQRAFHPIYWYFGPKAIIESKRNPGTVIGSQLTAYARAKTSRRNDREYDVAIGFLEQWPNCYVYSRISAKRKIAWIHLDYQKAGLCASADKRAFSAFNRIVLVSEECQQSFETVFPEFARNTACVENIISKQAVILRASEEEVHTTAGVGISFGTVCRIDFRPKGLDRAARVFARLKEEGYCFHWHVIGEGPDFQRLKSMIGELGLTGYVTLYGQKTNPLPYVKQFDFFLLPSVFEGKPMAVTEAQMLNVPPVVTRYASAHEQISSGMDGYIMENSEEGIYRGLKAVLAEPGLRQRWSDRLIEKSWDYSDVMNQIEKIIDG